jgi:phosphate-selective porin
MRLPRLTAILLPLAAVLASRAAAQEAKPAPSIALSGYLQFRETAQEHVGLTASINRARLTAAGRIAGDFSWKLQGEFRTGNVGGGKASVSLTDGYIRWQHRDLGIQAGQFKTPFTWEYTASLPDLETTDRATVVDSLAPKRDIGVMADYAIRKRATVSLGLFNGEGVNTTSNADSTLLGVGRVTLRPIPEVAVGVSAARYFGDSTRYGADLSFEGRRLTLRGEVAAQARDSAGGRHDLGWWTLAAVHLSDPVQLVGKYEDFRRDGISAQQKNRAWTVALNYFPVPKAVRLSLEYVSRRIGDPGQRKSLGLAQLQVRY